MFISDYCYFWNFLKRSDFLRLLFYDSWSQGFVRTFILNLFRDTSAVQILESTQYYKTTIIFLKLFLVTMKNPSVQSVPSVGAYLDHFVSQIGTI